MLHNYVTHKYNTLNSSEHPLDIIEHDDIPREGVVYLLTRVVYRLFKSGGGRERGSFVGGGQLNYEME